MTTLALRKQNPATAKSLFDIATSATTKSRTAIPTAIVPNTFAIPSVSQVGT